MELISTKPIFLQIKDYYETLIDNNSLKEGEEMPSVREVALFFKINPNTVQRAFSLMVEEGYLINIPKKGFYVAGKKIENRELIKKTIGLLLENGISKEEIIKYLQEEGKND